MRLTRHTNYAVRMLMYCATNEASLSHVPDIAKSFGMPQLFLFKILQGLTQANLIKTVRGRNGGIRLVRPASEVTLLDVVKVTEERFALADCFNADGNCDCPLVDNCELNNALKHALEAFFGVLADYTVADLAHDRFNLRHRLGLLPQSRH